MIPGMIGMRTPLSHSLLEVEEKLVSEEQLSYYEIGSRPNFFFEMAPVCFFVWRFNVSFWVAGDRYA